MRHFALIFLALILIGGCSRQSSPASLPDAASSPDGSFSFVTSVEQSHQDPKTYLCVVFEVRDRAGKTVHRENTHASDVMRWSMIWESNGCIRLDSSDIGTYRWQRQPDNSW